MTRDETIEMMAKAIYLSKRHATSWDHALDWLALEPHSTPALDVKTCRSDALAALTALEDAGVWLLVPGKAQTPPHPTDIKSAWDFLGQLPPSTKNDGEER